MELGLLRAPFAETDIEWRVQRSDVDGKGKPWALVVPYLDSRAVMDRLDEACGAGNWQNRFERGPDGGVVCGISIRVNEEWVTKWDGAEVPEMTEDESERKSRLDPVKTSLTNAFKRAAVQWGIGRYLYGRDAEYAVFNDGGKYAARIKGRSYRWNPPEQTNAGTQKVSARVAEEKSPADYSRIRTDIRDAMLSLAHGDSVSAARLLGEYTRKYVPGGCEITDIRKLSPKSASAIHARVMADVRKNGVT